MFKVDKENSIILANKNKLPGLLNVDGDEFLSCNLLGKSKRL